MEFQKYKEMLKTCKAIADRARKPHHRPIDEIAPCDEAMFLTRIIQAIDDRFGGYFGLEFGGAGDNGEVLAGYLDILIEMQIISCSIGTLKGEMK